MVPSSRLFLRISANGAFMYSLVLMRNIAGMPSGPAHSGAKCQFHAHNTGSRYLNNCDTDINYIYIPTDCGTSLFKFSTLNEIFFGIVDFFENWIYEKNRFITDFISAYWSYVQI